MFTDRKTKTSIRTTICSAITSRQAVNFFYHGGFRSAEPYCYGVLPDGNEALLCYQVSGYSEFGDLLGWKLFRSSEISILTVTGKHFTGAIPKGDSGYDSRYSAFTTTYCQVSTSPTGKSEPEQPTRLEQGDEKERTDYDIHEEYTASVESHYERMKRFRFSHLPFFPWKKKS